MIVLKSQGNVTSFFCLVMTRNCELEKSFPNYLKKIVYKLEAFESIDS